MLRRLHGIGVDAPAFGAVTPRDAAAELGQWSRTMGAVPQELRPGSDEPEELQAVDGIALKVLVNNWAAAPASQKEIAFQTALAVRQVEIGLASTLSLLFGFTVTVCGIALLGDRKYPKWVAGVAILGGVPTAIAGVVIAYTGFSSLAMAINMPASFLLLLWMLIVGVLMWRRAMRSHEVPSNKRLESDARDARAAQPER